MASYVLDSSIAVKWFLSDETEREYSLALLDALALSVHPIVPWLWFYEVSNVLLTQVRRGRIEYDCAIGALEMLETLPIAVDSPGRSATHRLLRLGHKHQLTCYDAAFLDLAIERNLPLATNDKALARAAANAGIPLFRI